MLDHVIEVLKEFGGDQISQGGDDDEGMDLGWFWQQILEKDDVGSSRHVGGLNGGIAFLLLQ